MSLPQHIEQTSNIFAGIVKGKPGAHEPGLRASGEDRCGYTLKKLQISLQTAVNHIPLMISRQNK